MTYGELQKSFGSENAVFSIHTDGVDWNANWDGPKFAADDFPQSVAVEGKVILMYEDVTSADFDLDGEGYITNPTWKQVMRFFDLAIEKSGDFHHVFLERLRQSGDVVELSAGS